MCTHEVRKDIGNGLASTDSDKDAIKLGIVDDRPGNCSQSTGDMWNE